MLHRNLKILIVFLSLLAGASTVVSAAGSTPAGLVDGSGRAFDARTLQGRWQLVYFGFTNCPEVCPTSLFEMTAAIDLLPEASRAQVTPVFVTVDPARDTPERMADYVKPLGHGFVTVSGSTEAIDRFAFANRIVAVRQVAEGGNYTVDHSSVVLLIGPDGREIERFPYSMDYREVARRMRDHIADAPLSQVASTQKEMTQP